VALDDLLAFEPRLIEAKSERSAVEFFYACTPQLVRYVIAKSEGTDGVAYVDADMCFFQNPAAFCAEVPGAEIILVEHRSGDPRAEAERGRFNVCFVHFAYTGSAGRALEWWCDMTLRSTATDSQTWGDQKYLDSFPGLFDSVGILREPGTTLAPWNVWQHELHAEGGALNVDDRLLVAYHFARLIVISPHFFSPVRREWLSRQVLRAIYGPYIGEIRKSLRQIESVYPTYSVGRTRRNQRGLLLGLLAGRVFYEGGLGVRRLGVYVPTTRKELRVLARVMQRHVRSCRDARAGS
jgi:hypothetical protein